MIRSAYGVGIATIDAAGKPLDIWFAEPRLDASIAQNRVRALTPEQAVGSLGAIAPVEGYDPARDVNRVTMEVRIADLDQPPADLYDLFLRLHLLSHRLVAPNGLNLDTMLDLFDHEIAWTSLGPCRPDRVGHLLARSRMSGTAVQIHGIFPVPPMLDYVCPSGVRIADRASVLLGAHLAPGTMVTPAGFCGVNAGTLGRSMVEGRISAGVVVGAGSDIGGGASIMGTMSGGGRHRIVVGERCLIGANAGIGISLGDDCLVEAGCYVTAGAMVRLGNGCLVKAHTLAGKSMLIFRRNSVSGALEALANSGRWAGLNPRLHPL